MSETDPFGVLKSKIALHSMLTPDTVRSIALSFPETDEAPHLAVTSFRVKKKIFATLNAPENRACLRFSEIDQDVFCAFAGSPFWRVPNQWGKFGWTLVDLTRADEEMLRDALTVAYCTAAPKKLAAPYLEGEP